jgi:hypothetical protein
MNKKKLLRFSSMGIEKLVGGCLIWFMSAFLPIKSCAQTDSFPNQLIPTIYSSDSSANGGKMDVLIDYSVRLGEDDISTWIKGKLNKNIPKEGKCYFNVYGEDKKCNCDSIEFGINLKNNDIRLFSKEGIYVQTLMKKGKIIGLDTIRLASDELDPTKWIFLLSRKGYEIFSGDEMEIKIHTTKVRNARVKRKSFAENEKMPVKIHDGTAINTAYEITPKQKKTIFLKVTSMIPYVGTYRNFEKTLPLAMKIVVDDGALPNDVRYWVSCERIRINENFK